jgi:hypothetical protein
VDEYDKLTWTYRVFYFFAGVAMFGTIARALNLSIIGGGILLSAIAIPVAIFWIIWWLDKVVFPESKCVTGVES